MTKWEYLVRSPSYDGPGWESLVEFLDRHGQDGWELVMAVEKTTHTDYIFKRPMTFEECLV